MRGTAVIVAALAFVAGGCGGPEKSFAPRDRVLALAPPPGGAEAQGERRTLVLAIDGVTVRRAARSSATARTSPLCGARVPALDWRRFGSSRDEVAARLVAGVRALLAPYDVRILPAPPRQGAYTMAAVGGQPALCGLGAGLAGLAPLDCGDANPEDIFFVFAAPLTRLSWVAVTVAHEFGHATGLVHTAEACDAMSPLLCRGEKRFLDREMTVFADQAGQCGRRRQNSHRAMLAALGARPPAAGDGGADAEAALDAGAPDAGALPPSPGGLPAGCALSSGSGGATCAAWAAALLLLAAGRSPRRMASSGRSRAALPAAGRAREPAPPGGHPGGTPMHHRKPPAAAARGLFRRGARPRDRG